MRLAILGANGHIGKNLTERFGQREDCVLHLYVRDSARMQSFCAGLQAQAEVVIAPFSEFDQFVYDAVINCIGVADPGKRAGAGPEIFRITEEFDNLVLRYLADNERCRYVNMSSGAAYGSDFSQPADDQRKACYAPNPVRVEDYYGVAKLHAEARHRAHASLSIVDLRLFGFFSRHIDLSAGFFLSEAARCILQSVPMQTDDTDIVRDYVHPDDLFSLVRSCVESAQVNDVLDVYSKQPATKFELLAMLKTEFGLTHQIRDDMRRAATGQKMNYYSQSRRAKILGYVPKYTAVEAVRQEMRQLRAANNMCR